MEVMWAGPYSWPGFETQNGLPFLPKLPGVYLQTVPYENGYLIYAAGLTRRTVPQRFREHTRLYMSGDYTVLDVDVLRQGVRQEVWHGWGWTPEKRTQFDEQQAAIVKAAQEQMAGFCIFVAHIGTEPRIMERLEASVIDNLYHQPPPLCDIPDRGMMLAPRRTSEVPIVVKSECAALLHGLPHWFEI